MSRLLSLVTAAVMVFTAAENLPAADEVTITVLYDNYSAKPGTKTDWGFSCLVEAGDNTILFDTGTNPDILDHNAKELEVDLSDIDMVVLSHIHTDHTGGLDYVLGRVEDIPVYFPAAFPEEYEDGIERQGNRPVRVDTSLRIADYVYITGDISGPVHEQALIIESAKGLVIITGCSHPGIITMIEKSREAVSGDLYLVAGGFHLMRHSADQVKEIIGRMRDMGVRKCGASHCTGDAAIALFREEFGDEYVALGTGRVLHIPENGGKD